MLLLVAAVPSGRAGERCAAHFPELRHFVETAGSRATPDETTALALADELAIERSLWLDEAAHHRSRLETVGATVGLARLDAIDAELAVLFDQLSITPDEPNAPRRDGDRETARLRRRRRILPEWPIRSVAGPAREIEPVHREIVVVRPTAGWLSRRAQRSAAQNDQGGSRRCVARRPAPSRRRQGG